MTDTAELEDAEVLLTYLLRAQTDGSVELNPAELATWTQELSDHLDDRIRLAKKNDRKNEWCALLDTRAHVALFSHFDEGILSAPEAFHYWAKLAKLAAQAPMFPLERFADRLAKYAGYIGTYPEYEALTQSIDVLVGERFGQFKAAEKCLERARGFYKSGDLPHAMAQLHRAKIDWYAEEALEKSMFAMRLLSSIYAEQGLFFAAKYYSLAISYLVLHSADLKLKPEIARALENAASCDYALGAWHGFLELSETAAVFYPHFARDPDSDFNSEDGILQKFAFHLKLVPVVTKLFHPQLEAFSHERCTRILERLGLDEVTKEIEPRPLDLYCGKEDELWSAIEDQLAGPPWSDAGKARYAQWSAHGVSWYVNWKNDYETTLVVEEFLAGLQLLLSDLAGYDLCLLRTALHVNFQVADPTGTQKTGGFRSFGVHFEPANEERHAVVTLPSYEQFRDGTLSHEDILVGTLAVISSLLAEVSLLPAKRFGEVIKERFAQGLKNKLSIAAPYSQILHGFVSKEDFGLSSRGAHKSSGSLRPFPLRPSEKLPWFNGPEPEYTEAKARERIENRYKNCFPGICFTLKRLSRNPEFQATLARLRSDGWKDWHVMHMIFNVTMNYRLDFNSKVYPLKRAEIEEQQRLLQQPEAEDAPLVPLD